MYPNTPVNGGLTAASVHAELQEIHAELGRRTLLNFTVYTNNQYDVNWHHRIVAQKLDDVLEGRCRRLMIFEPPQNGKALAVETPIPTPGGWRCIGDLKAGDLVFDFEGHPTSVIATSPVWKQRRVYNVGLDTGQNLLADEAHEWVVSTDRKQRGRLIRLETKALAQRKQSPSEYISRNPLVFHHPGLDLPEQELLIDPYTLGVWLGDGSSYSTVITAGDEDRDWIRARIEKAHRTSNQTTPATFGVLDIRRHITSLGLRQNKHIPSMYLRASRDQRLALLQGLIDTDGHVNPHGYVDFTNTNRRLAEDVRELVISLGVKAAIFDGRATIDGRDCGPKYRVCFFLEAAASLPRKAEKCRNQNRPDHFITVEEAGEADTVCIEVASPQHLFLAGTGMIPTCNSEQVSRRFPAYVLGKKPDKKIVACSYSMSLAEDMSRDVQKIMITREYRDLFPATRLREARAEGMEKRTQGQFEIVGRRGAYIAAGIDGPITGKTADIGIIDDPIKNRQEAESETYREKVWQWYKSAFATRQFGSGGAIIICQTRWHEDDLAGRLLRLAKENPDADQWDVLELPALAEDTSRAYDPRMIGEALWPKQYPLHDLKRRRAGMGEYDWAALYQQQPAPAGGGLFKKAWFADKYVDQAPQHMRMARGWDTAGTKDGGDYTAGVKIGEEFAYVPDDKGKQYLKSTGRFFVMDVQRGQLGPSGVDSLIKTTAENDGKKCVQREEKETGASGLAVVEARAKTLVGFDYNWIIITGSKVTRSKPFRTQCEAGNVYIVRGPWNAAYVDELAGFPTGKHDDQVDGSSAAFNSVLLEPPPTDDFAVW